MFLKIKNKIDAELKNYLPSIDRRYGLNSISPLLFSRIKDYVQREGKRGRPILFVLGYLGFAKKTPVNLYRAAISLELLHDFMLVHDDIIDKSATRRGLPSMHTMFDRYIQKKTANAKFNGVDLAIVAGDVLYALALQAFLAIREAPRRKEAALQKFIEAVLYTGSGEFIELETGLKSIDATSEKEIYRIYDLKTAKYTFVYPLAIGATLAGASAKEIKILSDYGLYLGRAFQIKDDIIGIFGKESDIGKPNITDLQEGKKTLLIWQAYKNSPQKDKKFIKTLLDKNIVTCHDLERSRQIIIDSGSLDLAKRQVRGLAGRAQKILNSSRINPAVKQALAEFNKKLLEL